MFSRIITSGDSFTSGYCLDNLQLAWPHILGNKLNLPTINLAYEGMGNDYIISSIMDCDLKDSLVICGLTHYSRIEFLNAKTNKRFTTILNRRGQTKFEDIFWQDFYDDDYYYEHYIKQIKMFMAWLELQQVEYFLFDALPLNRYNSIKNNRYLWANSKNMCDIIYPNQLPDGHPNAIGHEMMAETLYKIILDKSE
jgi:hypothetical protein